MTIWTWALITLCAAGIVLALVSSAIALADALRLNRRVRELRTSPFVTKLESLQIQVARISRIPDDAERLSKRAQAALESLREAPKTAGLIELTGAWRTCVDSFKSIVAELS